MHSKMLAACAISAVFLFAAQGPARADGIYIGAGLGPSMTNSEITSGMSHVDLTGSGARGSVFAGYGATVNRIYLGLEGAYSLGDGQSRANDMSGVSVRLRESHDFSIGPRLGYTFSPNLLVYGTVGYEALQLRTRVDGWGSSGTSRDYLNGVRIGLGLEAAVTPNVFVRGEYTHTWFGRETTVTGVPIDLNRGTATFGLGYRF